MVVSVLLVCICVINIFCSSCIKESGGVNASIARKASANLRNYSFEAKPMFRFGSSPIRFLYYASGTRYFSISSEHAATISLRDRLRNELSIIKGAGLYKTERVIKSPQSVNVRVEGYQSDMLNFCANNYLGLSSNPDVVSAAKGALDDFGAGLSSVRFICGTQTIHKELEGKISKFHEREDAILYASCFDANAGIFEVICSSPEDAILSDELNHASIIDGIRLCKAKKYRYSHRDMGDLETKLKDAQGARTRLIVTDGVFSMDGNVAPLPDIVALAKKYNAITFIDECHATGFFGPTGRGTEEYFGLPQGTINIVNSTLGKALGGAAGGYTVASKEIVDLLRQRSRPYLFSNSLPPPVVAAGAKVSSVRSLV
ncbi:hypothetical protein J437_LFUL000516 [Ladona fulva]|uniref:Aminotransferase class I/classII large domain-containing protein n=1 Tax=Ladona fulva TaxID=123851 RepID=A0A8K0JUH3_LADFU|nr:hypothetical protein J437_LFUL000516 [Ladona fulva]